jgi:hypothetical protein
MTAIHPDLLDEAFIAAMARQMKAGTNRSGRTPGDWYFYNTIRKLCCYQEHLTAHVMRAYGSIGAIDDTGESHYAAVACNAMICARIERNLPPATLRPPDEMLAELGRLWGLDDLQVRELIRSLALHLGTV